MWVLCHVGFKNELVIW